MPPIRLDVTVCAIQPSASATSNTNSVLSRFIVFAFWPVFISSRRPTSEDAPGGAFRPLDGSAELLLALARVGTLSAERRSAIRHEQTAVDRVDDHRIEMIDELAPAIAGLLRDLDELRFLRRDERIDARLAVRSVVQF